MEFRILFIPKNAIKGRALVDFIVEITENGLVE